MKTIEEVMTSTAAANTNVERIRKQLKTIKMVDVPAPTHIDLGLPTSVEIDPTGRRLVYDSEGRMLGDVSNSVYDHVQPIDFLREIEDAVLESGNDIDLSKLSYSEYADGRKITFRLPLREFQFKNAAKVGEAISTFLEFSTGYGGYYKTRIGLYTLRKVCSNGMCLSEKSAGATLRHTTGNTAKALAWVKKIVEISESAEKHEEFLLAADKVKVTKKEMHTMACKLMKIRESEKVEEMHVQRKRVYEQIFKAFDIEMARTGKTVFGLLQGATYYTNHMVKNDPNESDEYINVGGGLEKNAIAERYAMSLVN